MRLVPIEEFVEDVIPGEWGNEPKDHSFIKVIRTTNFTNEGKLDFSKEVVFRDIEPKKFAKKKLIPGDVLIEKSGGSPTQPVGRVVLFDITDGDFVTNNFTAVLRPGTNCYSKYLLYGLLYLHKSGRTLPYQNKTTGIINLKLDTYLKNERLPLLSVDTQKQIAQVLDEADTLIQKRKQAIAKLDELVQSVFLDMFGDYRINNKQFRESKVSDVVTELLAGWSTGGEDRVKKPGEFGVLTTSAVTTGTFNPNAYKVVAADVSLQRKKLVHPMKDDVLVSRMNTRELVGASCIVDRDYPELFLPDRLWKVVLKTKVVNPYYFVKAIQDKGFRNVISKIATGTSGSMLNISKDKFLGIKFLIPPMDLQQQFASRYQVIQSQKSLMQQQLAKMEENFNSLLQRAFKGELEFSQVGEWDAIQC